MDGTYRAYYGTWDPDAETSGTTPVGKFVFTIGYKENVVGGRTVRRKLNFPLQLVLLLPNGLPRWTKILILQQ